jgi:hypothetical protein
MKKKLFLLLSATFAVSSLFAQIKIGDGGRVSIGSTEPSTNYNLKVKAGSGYIQLGYDPSTTTAHFMTDRSQFYFNKQVKVEGGNILSSGDFFFKTPGYPYGAIRINNSNGYVGICKGPNAPQYALDVYDTLRVYSTLYSSDERFKEDINNTKPNDVNPLYNLEAKKYKLKKPEYESVGRDSDKKHFGFIAQEFQEHYPELVYEDSSGYLSINYTEIIPLLVEALKEQNSRINYLENKIKDSQLKKASSDEFNEMATSDAMLKQNRPNPFSENTEIEFYLPSTVQKAMLNIYDLQGKQVKSMNIAEREYGSAVIYGSELQPGMYHYSLIADGEVIGVEKMILTD